MPVETDTIRDYIKMVKIGSGLETNTNNYPEIRLAVLSDNSAQQLVKVLKAALLAKGFFPVIYEGEYNTIALDIINKKSDLFGFNPDYVLLNLSSQAYREIFFNENADKKVQLPQKYSDEIASFIKILTDKHYQVIVNSLAIPRERFFGNYSAHTLFSLYSSILKVNGLVREYINQTPGCYLNDIMYMSSQVGISHWYDEKLWAHSKYMCAPKYFVEIAESVAAIISVTKGKLTKCLVVDLDGVLWGGIIGDDGIEGIEIGEMGSGEIYQRFQSYLLELKNRGYILAVCSKNEYSNAVKPFREHPDMILKEKDIAVFAANWNDKASNIEYIAKTLNIALDSIIFIDNSHFERNQVREVLPRVKVPEMPEDPAEFAVFLEKSGLFETATFSYDDQQRNEMYRKQALRANIRPEFRNIDQYLKSLDMTITLQRFDEFNLPRIAQLLQRSNQFNLSTKRYSQIKCRDFMENNTRYYPIYVRLKDKYGDYGLVSAVCAEVKQNSLEILEYVMSCRVLQRGLEWFVMNHLVNYCKTNGLSKITGEYIPTPKNKLVKNFYKQFHFGLVRKSKEKEVWEIEVDVFQEKECFIKEEEKC